MSHELKKLIEEQGVAFKELRTKVEDLASGRITKAEFMEAEEKINNRLDEIETRMNRPGLSQPEKGKSMYHKSLMTYLRKGNDALTPDERKALIISDDTLGGYLAGSEMTGEIIKGITEKSPIRQIARVRQTGKRSTTIRKRTGQFAAVWAGEAETLSETAGLNYGVETCTPHKLYAWIIVSREDLEDSDFNLEQEIIQEAREQFELKEGTGFVSGSGSKQPEGLLTNPDVGETVSGNASALTTNGLLNLVYAVKTGYARNGKFLMRRDTIRQVRLLQDGQSNYIWQQSYQLGQPPTLLGYPVVECPDMPAVASNAYPVIFGDLSQAYQITDRTGIVVQRLVEKLADTDQVVFKVTKRVDGQVVLAEAIRKQKVST